MGKLEEYNNIPVHYCKVCLSLKIKTVVEGLNLDYCEECGGTDIEESHIEEWQNLYRKRYGFDYLTKKLNNNGRDKKSIY